MAQSGVSYPLSQSWSIGNGCHTKTWGDKWILNPSSFQVQAPLQVLNSNVYVRELIDNTTASWNTELINQIFSEDGANTILSIPLSLFGLHVKLIWKPITNGQFTVKSAII